MADASFIAGDWGTSHLRLFLCDGDGRILERADAAGAAAAAGRFANLFDALVAPWQQRGGPLPAVLCGMVGSSIGWVEAPYVPCPAAPEQIAAACVALRDGAIHLVPGMSCRNRLDAPDVMRGETKGPGVGCCRGSSLRGPVWRAKRPVQNRQSAHVARSSIACWVPSYVPGPAESLGMRAARRAHG